MWSWGHWSHFLLWIFIYFHIFSHMFLFEFLDLITSYVFFFFFFGGKLLAQGGDELEANLNVMVKEEYSTRCFNFQVNILNFICWEIWNVQFRATFFTLNGSDFCYGTVIEHLFGFMLRWLGQGPSLKFYFIHVLIWYLELFQITNGIPGCLERITPKNRELYNFFVESLLMIFLFVWIESYCF